MLVCTTVKVTRMRRNHRPPIPCDICGIMFEPYRASSKSCSQKCRNTTIPSTQRPEVNCVWCQKVFPSVNSLNKYCSTLCRDLFRADAKKKHMPDKPCNVCSSMFTPVCGSQVYCTDPCRVIGMQRVRSRLRAVPENKEKVHAYNLDYHERNYSPGRSAKEKNLRHCYGLAIEDFDAMLEAQKGLCCICGGPPPGKHGLYVEHHHATGKIRGLVCILCNNVIGNCRESIEILDKVKAYLLKHNGPV
jgi:recombination endonuclease VII